MKKHQFINKYKNYFPCSLDRNMGAVMFDDLEKVESFLFHKLFLVP